MARLASSIYGTVLAIALIAAYSAEADLDPLLIAAALLVTLSVFWLAHAQAELLALRYTVGHGLTGDEIKAQVRHGWPMVEAGFPPAVALVLGGVGLLGDRPRSTSRWRSAWPSWPPGGSPSAGASGSVRCG